MYLVSLPLPFWWHAITGIRKGWSALGGTLIGAAILRGKNFSGVEKNCKWKRRNRFPWCWQILKCKEFLKLFCLSDFFQPMNRIFKKVSKLPPWMVQTHTKPMHLSLGSWLMLLAWGPHNVAQTTEEDLTLCYKRDMSWLGKKLSLARCCSLVMI